MAHAALVSVLQLLDQTTHTDQFHSVSCVKQQVETLIEKFCFLQSFLEDDSPKSQYVKNTYLERRIREAAYKVQDIIEFNVLNQLCPERDGSPARSPPPPPPEASNSTRTVKKPSWRLLFTLQKFLSLQKQIKENVEHGANYVKELTENSADKIKKLNVVDEVCSIVEEVMKIKQSQNTEHIFQVTRNYSAEVNSPRKMTMVGFDEDLMEIKDQLCGDSSKLQIIPIVGMGGIGKTTLATNIFHDPLIEYHFHIRAWATISQRYNIREIIRSLLSSISTNTDKLSRETEDREMELAVCLYKSLKGRKFLIVLDDIWSTEAWDDIKMLFPDDRNGSRIVLTTRLVDVAVYANSFGPFHNIQFLNEDQSWNLLREKVFAEEICPPELEEIGKLIARNCRGLPLSIVVVAGILSRVNKTRYKWENIARDVSSAVTRVNGEHFSSNILSLSYDHLPHHLKACFLYLGNFPEDYEIPVFKLITLWVAEGFLKPIQSKSSEEVAEEYLKDLVKRSLVYVTRTRSNGGFRFCSIHDLLRDLCIRKARDENFFHFMNGIQFTVEDKRRLCFSKAFESYHFKNANTAIRSPLRSVFSCYYNERLTGFSLLRVLDVLEVVFESFPVELLQLFHLRYIAFSTGFIRHCTLPPSLPKLRNLQTLIVGSSVTFGITDPMVAACLPIWKMPQLRHLVFLNINLSPFPCETDEEFAFLQNLQTLSRVRNFRFTREAVEMIPNLKKLKLVYTGRSHVHMSVYELENLVHFQKLETLNLKFQTSTDWWRDPVPVRFGLPLNLKKFTLSGCGLSSEDLTVIGSLANLEVLKLLNVSVVGALWEVVEEEYSRLRFLMMEWLDIKNWLAESGCFPSLERLVIRHCSALENIPSGIGETPTLRVIEVDDSEMAADSAEEILEEQRDLGNDDLQVRFGH
ncbi:hypothetical protein ABFS83_09G107200 [Erythranthe nasuta]